MNQRLVTLLKFTALILSLFLSAAIAFALLNTSLMKETDLILEYLWGQIMLGDLYIGFFVFFCLVTVLEKSALKASLWFLPTLILGNIVPLIYILTSPTLKIHFRKTEKEAL